MRDMHSMTLILILIAGMFSWPFVHAGEVILPAPQLDSPPDRGSSEQTAYFAGGC